MVISVAGRRVLCIRAMSIRLRSPAFVRQVVVAGLITNGEELLVEPLIEVIDLEEDEDELND